ncbi:THO complex subunit 1 [Citrus sinensis]|uniref:THO complex subunit 1 n=1 Tax=Citrus sinensis TaxID=2711 RepID=A0ACB8KD78_CITSI|nr:THO complex subunit 1 [Citrus sinensis]
MEVFRRAILQAGPPENFALQTVQEVIKPQKQTKLAQDENQLLENMLRTLLQELVSSAVQSGEPIMHYGQSIDDGETSQAQIPRLLDIVLYLCEKEHVEGGMIFQLLEDLTEMSTMKNCKDIFGYIESKQDILGKLELFARGKLVMLRTCNQLLRRLSKANDVVFCGRILMFLAHFFPLSERSAVNIKGVFNTSNETKYEKDPPDGIPVDFNFYKTFWSLQVVLNTFDAQPLSDEVGDANVLEEEAATFNIKYLTSSKLMGLELKDPSFRRHVLVQCLILFDYLKAPGKNDKDLPSESMKEEMKSCEERVKKLLETTPPKGKDFLHSIEHILEREKNWVWWKRDGCPPFEKQSMEKKAVQDGPKKRPRWRLGNKELSQLWKWADQNPNALTDPQRVRTPAITEYWKPLADDMDPSAGIEAEYHHKNSRKQRYSSEQIAVAIVFGFVDQLQAWWDHYLSQENRNYVLNARRPETEAGPSGKMITSTESDAVDTLIYAILLQFVGSTDGPKSDYEDHIPSSSDSNIQQYCNNGSCLRFSARQDLDGFSRFTDHGIEGVVPLELLPPHVRSRYEGKANDRSKRAKKEDSKVAPSQAEENQIAASASENDGEGIRADLEASATPVETDVTAGTGNISQSGTATPDEHQKQSSDTDMGQEAGQLDADAEADAGMMDGETDAEVDLEAVGILYFDIGIVIDGKVSAATIDGSDSDDLNPNDAFGDGSDIVRDLDDYKYGDDSGDKPNDDVVEAQACIRYEENTGGFEFNSTSDKIVMRLGQLFVSVYELRNVLKIFAIENEVVEK